MAGVAHLKVAASNMHRAASDVQADVTQLRNSIGEHERNMNREVNQIQDHIRRSEADLVDSSKSDQERAAIRKHIQDMQRDISDRKHNFEELRGQMQRQIDGLQTNAQAIENQARQVEKNAAALQ